MSIIEMRDVVKKYDNGTTALRGVTVKVEPGEFAYIVGPSGAGKSTFIRLLYREVALDKGALTVAGFNLAKIKKRDVPMLRRKVGVVFQDYKLLPKKTVYENIAYAMIEELDVTSIKILRQLIDDTSGMAAVASAMAKRALMENNLDLEKYFNALALELLDQASIYMIYSGEFLEVTSSANRPELEKKLQNEMIKIDKFIEATSDMDLEEVVDVLEANKKKIGALMI